MSSFHFEVPPETEKIRADAFCITVLEGITRSKLKAGLEEIRINGKSAKLSSQVRGGDRIELIWQDPIPDSLEPEPIELPIIFENEDVIIVDKPAGMVTHPAAGNWTGTLVNALEYYRRYRSPLTDEFSHTESAAASSGAASMPAASPEPQKLEPMPAASPAPQSTDIAHLRTGIVHRLDKDTSGLIITARNRKTEAFLKQAFKQRKVDKYYLAILNGIPEEKTGTIITSVFRKGSDRTRFSASADLSKGKYARSRYKVLRTYGNYALVLFKIYTGRTHQIRLHARFIGCPVAGDPVYGKKNGIAAKARKKNHTKEKHEFGLLLHAYKIRIRLPNQAQTEPKRVFTAGIPQRFKKAVKRLKENPDAVL